MDTLVMVRTICCESHRSCGDRCVNCPNLPENRAALESFRRQESSISLGRAAGFGISADHPAPQPINRIVLSRAS